MKTVLLLLLSPIFIMAHGLSFLTRLPIPAFLFGPKNPKLQEQFWKHSPSFYPLIGILYGAFMAGSAWFLSLSGFNTLLSSALLVVIHVLLGSSLHLDGLADTFDGFGSYRDREKILEIMKDSRSGVMGVSALILSLLIRFGIYNQLMEFAWFEGLLIMSIAGKSSLNAGMLMSPYAKEDGLGKQLWQRKWSTTAMGLFFMGSALMITLTEREFNQFTLIPLLLWTAWQMAWTLVCRVKIQGQTGDTLGANSELSELVMGLSIILVAQMFWTS